MKKAYVEINGFKGYYINNNGDIIGLRGRVMKPSEDKDGYLVVNLYYAKGKYKTKRVHRLVAEHFIGEIPEGYEVNHLKGDKRDNRHFMLEIVKPKENIKHMINVLGKNIKINYQIAQKIRKEFATGKYTRTDIAKRYGLSIAHVCRIIKNKRWTKEYHE